MLYALHLLRDQPAVSFLPVKVPLAIFCASTVVSVLWAANPGVGWFAVRKLVLFTIWLLAVNLVVGLNHLHLLFQTLFFESALAGLVAAGQFVAQYRSVRALHPHQVYFYMTTTRIHGFMGHWMNFGGQQMLVFAGLGAYLLLSGEARTGLNLARRSICWLVMGVVSLSIALNFTRGVWLGCFAAFVYLVARWKARWLWALPVMSGLLYLTAPSLVRQRMRLALHPTQDPALSIRLEMWQVAFRMIRAHPWVGVGPDNIEQVYLLYLPPGRLPEVGYRNHLHNDFLQFGAERGLPCLTAWVWLMAALGWHFWRARRTLRAGRWVADAAFASWLALLVEGCFEFNFGTSPVLMVFLFLSATPMLAERLECREEKQSMVEL
jgi:putative inorganic carbon (hco3(-)) transporter